MRGLVLRLRTRASSRKTALSWRSTAARLQCAMRCDALHVIPGPSQPCPVNFNPSQSKARQRNATQSNAGQGPLKYRNAPQSNPTAAAPHLALKTPSPPHRLSSLPAAVAPTPNPARLCSALLCSARPSSASLTIEHHRTDPNPPLPSHPSHIPRLLLQLAQRALLWRLPRIDQAGRDLDADRVDGRAELFLEEDRGTARGAAGGGGGAGRGPVLQDRDDADAVD